MKLKLLNQITRIVSYLLLLMLLAFKVTYAQLYHHQYAVVIGIDKYSGAHWRDRNLNYARGDAEAVEKMLKEQGFIVYSLYDKKATKAQITSILEDQMAPILQKHDAILFFFAGHGTTRELGGKDWGYIVPSDATDQSSSYISMDELRTLSRKMGNAKHQAFIMDCCYGGQLGTRSGGISTNVPNYLKVVGTRVARQILTAGGRKQEVADGGPGGHSVFAGYFLKAVAKGLADTNFDGWITFSELVSYLVPAASSSIQTPGSSTLPGHEQGEFLFKSEKTHVAQTDTSNNSSVSVRRRSDSDNYEAAKEKTRAREEAEAKAKALEEAEAKAKAVKEARAITPKLRIDPSTPLVDTLEKSRIPKKKFRSESKTLTTNTVISMLQDKGFFDSAKNKNSHGFSNNYKVQHNGEVVYDRASGLMWQQHGANREMTYKGAKAYIDKINSDQFAGYSDWRLPTLEEAMSLIEPEKNSDDLYIDSIFESKQKWIWTSDLYNDSGAWVVLFDYGRFFNLGKGVHDGYVRAVR